MSFNLWNNMNNNTKDNNMIGGNFGSSYAMTADIHDRFNIDYPPMHKLTPGGQKSTLTVPDKNEAEITADDELERAVRDMERRGDERRFGEGGEGDDDLLRKKYLKYKTKYLQLREKLK